MKNKNGLFPIGVLANMTGVHIRSLRYYEKIGILRPAFINESTGYRYYSYRQTRIIEAIQYCVELDIPLKKFSEFISEGDGQIDYTALLSYGKIVADEKMRKIRERQQFIEEMQQGVAHAEECSRVKELISELDEKYYYCIPYKGSQLDENFQPALLKLISDMEKNGFRPDYDCGLLWTLTKGEIDTYLFIDLKKPEKDISQYSQIIRVPAGKYLCVTSDKSGFAEDIFQDKLKDITEGYMIETELFLGKYQYVAPVYELRFFME